MIGAEVALAFLGVSVLLGLSPGPDNLFVLTQSLAAGRRAGILVTVGLCTGILGHTALIAAGVTALLAASPVAFAVLRAAGCLYLLWLAWQAFRAGAAGVGTDTGSRLGALALYRRGVIMNLTNPKVGIFFLAFMPQFIDAGAGSVPLQFLQLGLLFVAATLVVFCSIAAAAGLIATRLEAHPALERGMNVVAGVVFASLAANLALQY